MRPLRLEVKNFTAFRDPVDLDFTKLDVFSIVGPTGSGKSSLLDAITYALYGRVERVGDRVSQLISQGQPRMAVTLEFEVEHDRYRVTRSTPARGSTKIMLERFDGAEWRQAGEGADRVRDAEQTIARMIGLTYDGFTRSVLLPQGKFAEFLIGDPRKRRDILTELLGLSLFRKMAEHAGVIAKECSLRAQTMIDVVEREYGDATPEAVRAARSAARSAREREKALAEAAERVVELLGRWQESRHSIDELRAYAEEAGRVVEGAEAVAVKLEGLGGRLREAVLEVETRVAASNAAGQALDEARAALRDAEASLGLTEDLSRAQLRAHSLVEARRARDAKMVDRTRAAEAAEGLRQAVAEAERAAAEYADSVSARAHDLEKAEAGLEEARHADLVAAVSAELQAGDPCPVCGVPLQKPPQRGRADGLRRATKSLEKARNLLDAARQAAAKAERRLDVARRDLDANAVEEQRLAAEVGALEAAMTADEESLRAILGDLIPDDPRAVLGERLAELQRLDRAERDAARATAEASQALLKAGQERERVAALIDRQRDKLAVDHRPLLDRARTIGVGTSSVRLPPAPGPDDPEALQRFARGLAEHMADLADRLDREIEERSSLEGRLAEEGLEVVGGLVEPVPTLEALARSVDSACREATGNVATTAHLAEGLAHRLERKQKLDREAGELDDRARLFRVLALELRADRLVAFLQAEALHVLAMAGSERLANLSDGRYRLACRDDEFLVVDTWNGDEERSARTLSGGETFLASLALALALSEHARSLSVTDRARLDSLFLDEGFGTLDPESLRVVVDAIEQLGGDGRLVGVITHVRELAEQFPRLEVQKSPRGSHVTLVP